MRDRAVRPDLRRWLRFNAVGAAGIALQLGLLALLTRVAGWPYLPATLVAVELTVLHNLAWHEGWTWRDRPARSPRARLVRAARFHGVAGAVSLAGNVTIMWLVAGRLGLDPILANMLAIAACSLLNFVGSDRLVFASGSARRAWRFRASRRRAARTRPGALAIAAGHPLRTRRRQH